MTLDKKALKRMKKNVCAVARCKSRPSTFVGIALQVLNGRVKSATSIKTVARMTARMIVIKKGQSLTITLKARRVMSMPKAASMPQILLI